jgi:hypothetical protein
MTIRKGALFVLTNTGLPVRVDETSALMRAEA